ncbi:MAG: 5'-nucleotidase C-terminal domain-containing protein [Burkholderiales bacterium]|nr:5'-nucleotidase C-terminal domain-containing protein [Burkholderiales bacterium]
MKKTLSMLILFSMYTSYSYAYDDITVVSINDFHGQVMPNKNMVGAAKISTFLQNYRKEYPNTVVVLAGDNYQGTAISNLSNGKVNTDFFNYIGVKYSAIGNHEFDYGQKMFESWVSTSNFKFLAANIFESNTGKIFKYAEPYGIVTVANGKKVAFIGLATLETPSTTVSSNVDNLKFTDPVKAANKWVNHLNSLTDKPDTIVLLTHIPSHQESNNKIDYQIDNSIKTSEIDYVTKNVYGVSALLSGHSHMLVNGFMNGKAVVQGASQGKDLSILHYDCHTTESCIVTPEIIDLSVATKDLSPDPTVESIIDYYLNSNKAILEESIAKSAESLDNMPISGNYNIKLTYIVADIMKNATNSDVGLQNTYGIRRSLPADVITYGMIYEVMPFDNTVVTLKIKGADLFKLIKHSLPSGQTQIGVFAGITVELNKNNSINKVYVNGKLLNLKKIYTVAAPNFVVSGGDGFNFSKATNINDTHITIRETIRKSWLKDGIAESSDWQNIKKISK